MDEGSFESDEVAFSTGLGWAGLSIPQLHSRAVETAQNAVNRGDVNTVHILILICSSRSC